MKKSWIAVLLLAAAMMFAAFPAAAEPDEETIAELRIQTLTSIIHECLVANDLIFTYDEDENEFKLRFTIDSSLGNCDTYITVEENGIGVNTFSPIKVSEENRSLMAEFLIRATYNLRLGHFEMDFRDGEILYRAYQITNASYPVVDDIYRLIAVGPGMMEEYGDGLAKVALNGYDPELAVAECEED